MLPNISEFFRLRSDLWCCTLAVCSILLLLIEGSLNSLCWDAECCNSLMVSLSNSMLILLARFARRGFGLNCEIKESLLNFFPPTKLGLLWLVMSTFLLTAVFSNVDSSVLWVLWRGDIGLAKYDFWTLSFDSEAVMCLGEVETALWLREIISFSKLSLIEQSIWESPWLISWFQAYWGVKNHCCPSEHSGNEMNCSSFSWYPLFW